MLTNDQVNVYDTNLQTAISLNFVRQNPVIGC